MDFGQTTYDCPMVNLFKLMQTGFTNDYHKEFNMLAIKVYRVSMKEF